MELILNLLLVVVGFLSFVPVNAIRGGKKPWVEEATSSFAEALGDVVQMPVWASTCKVINTVIDIYSQKTSELIVGSLEYKRDWSYAYDIVKAINLIIDETNPVDYVIGSGTGNTILDMIKYVFEYFNLDYHFFDNDILNLFQWNLGEKY